MTTLFTEDHKVLPVKAATSAGQNTITTDNVDMQQDDGYAEVVFLLRTDAIVSTSAVAFVVQAADTADFSDGKDVGAALSIEDTDDDSAVVITVLHPPARYVALSVTIDTANAAIGPIFAILRRARTIPVAYADTDKVITHEVVNEPLGETLTAQEA